MPGMVFAEQILNEIFIAHAMQIGNAVAKQGIELRAVEEIKGFANRNPSL